MAAVEWLRREVEHKESRLLEDAEKLGRLRLAIQRTRKLHEQLLAREAALVLLRKELGTQHPNSSRAEESSSRGCDERGNVLVAGVASHSVVRRAPANEESKVRSTRDANLETRGGTAGLTADEIVTVRKKSKDKDTALVFAEPREEPFMLELEGAEPAAKIGPAHEQEGKVYTDLRKVMQERGHAVSESECLSLLEGMGWKENELKLLGFPSASDFLSIAVDMGVVAWGPHRSGDKRMLVLPADAQGAVAPTKGPATYTLKSYDVAINFRASCPANADAVHFQVLARQVDPLIREEYQTPKKPLTSTGAQVFKLYARGLRSGMYALRLRRGVTMGKLRRWGPLSEALGINISKEGKVKPCVLPAAALIAPLPAQSVLAPLQQNARVSSIPAAAATVASVPARSAAAATSPLVPTVATALSTQASPTVILSTLAPSTSATIMPAATTSVPPVRAATSLATTTSVVITSAPSTSAPTTSAPTTSPPSTTASTTSAPTTSPPSTTASTTSAASSGPSTSVTSTSVPSTSAATTSVKSTSAPSTSAATTSGTSTSVQSTSATTTVVKSISVSSTSATTTSAATTSVKSTSVPSTSAATTSVKSTPVSSSSASKTSVPSTAAPSASAPSTSVSSTSAPSTSVSSTSAPTSSHAARPAASSAPKAPVSPGKTAPPDAQTKKRQREEATADKKQHDDRESKLASTTVDSGSGHTSILIVTSGGDGEGKRRVLRTAESGGSQSRGRSPSLQVKAIEAGAGQESAHRINNMPLTNYGSYESGYVFGCNSTTYQECIDRLLFGNAHAQWYMVREIKVGRTALFLFNYTTRKLQGLFVAVQPPGINIEPTAWTDSRRRYHTRGDDNANQSPFPAQVRVREVAKLVSLGEAEYRNVLMQTNFSDKNFSVELTSSQARELIRLMVHKHFP